MIKHTDGIEHSSAASPVATAESAKLLVYLQSRYESRKSSIIRQSRTEEYYQMNEVKKVYLPALPL